MSDTVIIMVVNPYLHFRKFVVVPLNLEIATFLTLMNDQEPCRPNVHYLYHPKTNTILNPERSFSENGVSDGELFYLF